MDLSVSIEELVLDGVDAGDPRVGRAVEQEVAHALRGRALPTGVDATAVAAAVQTAVARRTDEVR
jgi:hypothetical protein